MGAGAVSLRKSHDIVILSFCNIVKGQANYKLQLIMIFGKSENTNGFAPKNDTYVTGLNIDPIFSTIPKEKLLSERYFQK